MNYEEKAAKFKKEMGLDTPHNSGLEIGSEPHGKRMTIYLEWVWYGKDAAKKIWANIEKYEANRDGHR